MKKRKSAWIFDLDGTLVKTQCEFHAPAEARVLKAHGIAMDPREISDRFAGVHTLEVFRQLAPDCNANDLLAEKWEHMEKLACIKPIQPVDYALRLINQLSARNIPMGIASASPRDWIHRCLQNICIESRFDCFVSADDVARGKPAPDIFLLAAARMGIDPQRCIAVEDGEAGVHAALAAGMLTFWLTESKKIIPEARKIRSLKQLL